PSFSSSAVLGDSVAGLHRWRTVIRTGADAHCSRPLDVADWRASVKRVRLSLRDVSWWLIIASILFWTSLAEAHPQQGQASGFITGFLHPWSGADHILAMIAVGIWGAQLGAPAIWLLPVTFPMVMAIGGFLGLIGIRLPGVEIGIALSALLLGAAVFAEARPKLIFAAILVGCFGLFH